MGASWERSTVGPGAMPLPEGDRPESGQGHRAAPLKASDLLVRCLETEGIRHIFGIPGEENLDILESLEDSTIRFVVTRHEQTAGFMAATCGRLTEVPGVCLSTLGPVQLTC